MERHPIHESAEAFCTLRDQSVLRRGAGPSSFTALYAFVLAIIRVRRMI